jgi:hypothetical protein
MNARFVKRCCASSRHNRAVMRRVLIAGAFCGLSLRRVALESLTKMCFFNQTETDRETLIIKTLIIKCALQESFSSSQHSLDNARRTGKDRNIGRID